MVGNGKHGFARWVIMSSRGKGATCKEYWQGMVGVVGNGGEEEEGD